CRLEESSPRVCKNQSSRVHTRGRLQADRNSSNRALITLPLSICIDSRHSPPPSQSFTLSQVPIWCAHGHWSKLSHRPPSELACELDEHCRAILTSDCIPNRGQTHR